MSIYLIDFENVGESGLKGIEKLKESDTVILFYSKNALKVSIDILNSCPVAVKFFKADVGTKNALDFQLVSYLGMIVNTSLFQDNFFIVSKDSGYSAVVKFWKKQGVTVKLVPDLSGKVSVGSADEKKSDEKRRNDIETVVTIALGKNTKKKKIDKIVDVVVGTNSKNQMNTQLSRLMSDGKQVSAVIKSVRPFTKNYKT